MAATKTLLTQIVSLEILALYLAEMRGTLSTAEVRMALDELGNLPDLIGKALSREADVASIAKNFTSTRDFFYLGRHVGYPWRWRVLSS